MTVTWMSVGATTHEAATFAVRSNVSPCAVRVDTDPAFSAPTTSSGVALTNGVSKPSITGLSAGTRYYWQAVENGTPSTTFTGQFRTHPVAAGNPANFKIGWLYCSAGNVLLATGTPALLGIAVTNAPVFDAIRTQALAEDWTTVINGGDAGYWNWGVDVTESLANRRVSWDDLFMQTRQHELYRSVPWMYSPSDHDFAANDSDGTYASKGNFATVYRERMPHYPLDSATAVYQSTPIGRGLVVLLDTMYNRSPVGDTDNSSKTMLGSAQKTWLDGLLGSTSAETLILCSPDAGWERAPTAGAYNWSGFSVERAELVTMMYDHGFRNHNTVLLCGDFHRSILDDGSNNPYGGFPLMLAGPIGSNPSGPFGSNFTHGGRSLRQSYGTVDVRDNGGDLAVTLEPLVEGVPWARYTLHTGGATRISAGTRSHVTAR